MPGQKGNRGGQPGRSGRKGAYQEHQDAAWLAGKWLGPVERAELEKRIAGGSYGIRDMWLWKAISGTSEAILKQAADKLLPDRSPVDEDGNSVASQVLALLDHGHDLGGSEKTEEGVG